MLTPGTIRKVQLKAIALDRHYISQFEAAKRTNPSQGVISKQAQDVVGVGDGEPTAPPAADMSTDPDDLGVPADDIGMPVDDSDESESEGDNLEQEGASGAPILVQPRDRELQAQLDDSRRQIMNITQ